MSNREENDVRFGKKWLKEIMKLPKAYIVEEFVKEKTLENERLSKINDELTELLETIDSYLSPNPNNYIGCNSVIHSRIKQLLTELKGDAVLKCGNCNCLYSCAKDGFA